MKHVCKRQNTHNYWRPPKPWKEPPMPDFKRAAVFADPEELSDLLERFRQAQTTPVMLIGEVDTSAMAWKAAFDALTACALRHGLPEITGEYGLDGETGEFLAPA